MSSAELLFVGTGTSEGVPRVTCLTANPRTCMVCADALKPGSKNRRRNTTVVVRVPQPSGAATHILIDPGKFFYQGAIQWFPEFDIPSLDAVVLTHAHYDAVGGLDDLRDWTNNLQESIPVYLRKQDLDTVSKIFYYLVDPGQVTTRGTFAKLVFNEVTAEPFDAAGLKLTPLPVWHGPPYTSQGYRFGDVCYLPDVSEIPEETAHRMENCELLVLDALRPGRTHGSHLTIEQAVDVARRFRPGRTLLVGMCHDVDHETVSADLLRLRKTDGLDVDLAYDGMRTGIRL